MSSFGQKPDMADKAEDFMFTMFMGCLGVCFAAVTVVASVGAVLTILAMVTEAFSVQQ